MGGRVRVLAAASAVLGLVLVAAPAVHADEARVREIVREGRVVDLVRRVASISGDVRSTRTTDSVQVDLSSDVLFAFGSAALSPQASTRIGEVAERIANEATGPVTVVGHTDSVGDGAYNQELSEQRAQVVANALAAISPAGYQVSGRGESEPVVPNEVDGADDPEGRQLNRRVSITFAVDG